MKKLLPILLTACVLLSGCNNTTQASLDNNKTSSGTGSIDDTSKHDLIRDSENVKFKYDKPQNEQIPVGVYNYSQAEASKDTFLKLFSGEPKCTEKDIPNGFREEYDLGDESGSIMERSGDLTILYNTSQGGGFLSVEYDAQSPDEKTEFDFISRKEIVDKLSETVKELLEINIQLKIDAVSAERFSKDVDAHIKAAAELHDTPPTADKYGTPADFYMVTFIETIDGIPIEGRFGNAIFTAKGMELLSVYSPIKVSEKVPETNAFISLDGAEKLLKDKYELLFLDKPVEVESAELFYVIYEDKLTPAWKFTFADGTAEYYNAYSGKEIVFYYPGEGA